MAAGTTHGPDRNLALELVRVTEAAALASAAWVGRGDKIAADQAAVDAMRQVLDTVHMDGVVVIGEGEKDEAPMLYNGEQIGNGEPPQVDIAVDPLEGTTLTAKGMPRALAVIALSERGSMFDPGPCVYMEKLAAGERYADLLDLDRPLEETLALIAERKGSDIADVMVMMLDRPRHEEAIAGVRAAGARVSLIADGDVSAALRSSSLRGQSRPICWPPVHLIAAAAMTPSGVPPMPKRMSAPLPAQAVETAPITSPAEISRMRAPASRTSAIRSACRGRSRMTAVRSRTDSPLALATASRLAVGDAVMSMTPTQSGPTAIFSM
ncbi:MAG: glpX [Solirubrobacteraceae bacterium]|nr:glpX [Solirubrobacteraceae bacterium]